MSSERNTFTISRRGAQILEGMANGRRLWEVADLLDITTYTIRSHCIKLSRDMSLLRSCESPLIRGMSLAIAGGLIKPKDMKQPGEPFIFTADPDEQSRFVLEKGNRRTSMPPPLRWRMPVVSRAKPLGRQRFSILQRNYLSCLAVGMSVDEIVADPEVGAENKWVCNADIVATYDALGVRNATHAIGQAAALNIITLDEALLDTEMTGLRPPLYEEDIEVVVPHSPFTRRSGQALSSPYIRHYFAA